MINPTANNYWSLRQCLARAQTLLDADLQRDTPPQELVPHLQNLVQNLVLNLTRGAATPPTPCPTATATALRKPGTPNVVHLKKHTQPPSYKAPAEAAKPAPARRAAPIEGMLTMADIASRSGLSLHAIKKARFEGRLCAPATTTGRQPLWTAEQAATVTRQRKATR